MHELLTAIALVMIIEGILPFAAPKQWKSMIAKIGLLPTTQIRFFGLSLMIVGLLLLSFIK